LAKAVADLIERYAPVYLCGYSMGAFVAARVAAERPEGIRRLVLCRSQHKAGRDRATSHEVLPIAVRVVADEGGFLPRIQAPTLVLCGRRDRACFPDMQLIADAIPNATALVVPHTGHSLPVTHAEAFNAIVSGFLAEAGAGTPR